MKLYKYRSISPFTESIFKDEKIWLSNSAGLNDPFECSIQTISESYIKEQVLEMKKAHLLGFFDSMSSANTRSMKATQRKIRKAKTINAKHIIMRKAYKKYANIVITRPEDTFRNLDKQLDKAGIFSLSEDPLNELMWAHYGEQNKGIAIGFEIDKESRLFREEKILKVNYNNQVPKLDSKGLKLEIDIIPGRKNKQRLAFDDKTFQKVISTKSKAWEYENVVPPFHRTIS